MTGLEEKIADSTLFICAHTGLVIATGKLNQVSARKLCGINDQYLQVCNNNYNVKEINW
jgi:hypothetical protein